MANNPVQVILNTRDFFVAPDPGRFGPAKDFFADQDQEFVAHRDKLLRQVASIQTVIRRSGMPPAAILKVSLRREAWAKSHRPQRALFPPTKRPCVAAAKLGELYFHVTAEDVQELAQEIAVAEPETRRRVSKNGHEYVSPSDQRSDVGAIESIELPTASDKRQFELEQAIKWLSDPRTSGAYFVELFSIPPAFLPEFAVDYFARRVQEIESAAGSRNLSINTFAVDVKGESVHRPTGVVGIRLIKANDRSFSNSRDEHLSLLTMLDANPYVRRVMLPPIIVAADMQASVLDVADSVAIPAKSSRVIYPKVGIVDGGCGANFTPWRLGTHTIVAPEHQQTDHGSFIAGLLIGGQKLNDSNVCAEVDGCEVFDIGILPDTDQPDVFDTYYPNGVVDFFTELDNGVELARRRYGVRIFNMSLNLLDPVQGDGYGVVASMLDRIADKHDVLFVISAGNLSPSDCRSEWSSDPQAALQYLAARNVRETVLQPAESSRAVAVGALNPPGCAGRVASVPAAYTCRGPGLRVGVKPDVGHYGGALPDAQTNTGLKSWNSASQVIFVHGTSYATPLVAKPLAVLDSRIESPLSREALLALLIHGCEIPTALQHEELREVARQFTGFGVPTCCDEMLETPDHAITLVFADTLHAHREMQFEFAWPKSLVNENGGCRGDIRMTLVYRPPLNRDFGSEFVRVNVDAHLRQEEDDTFVSRLKQAFLPEDSESAHFEHELIQHGLKWWPIKVYRGSFPRGKGKSSNWKLSVESLARAEEGFPAAGVPFALIVTIADLQESEPVFNDLRLHLRTRNVQMADIRTATQIRVAP
jgi:hypothetical protein